MSAYYNEIDPFAAAWLRELIADGLIAPGDVDERSIEDVEPGDLTEYTQCHFFAGIGGWSLALRHAGWPDDKPVWTGSCPCQPFSAAGKGGGTADERHLWPAFHHLIRLCRPDIVFGEQVEAAVKHGWLDLIQADLEGEGYAVGAVVLGAHSVGAPHIRQRLWWVANCYSGSGRQGRQEHGGRHQGGNAPQRTGFSGGCMFGSMADGSGQGLEKHGQQSARQECTSAERSGQAGELGLPDRDGRIPRSEATATPRHWNPSDPTSIWSDIQWIECRDGKHRPIPTEPALFPLAHGVSNRVGLLRGAGNAIVPQIAAEFIAAYLGASENQHGRFDSALCEPRTELGLRLKQLRQAYLAQGGRTLSEDELDTEIRHRRIGGDEEDSWEK